MSDYEKNVARNMFKSKAYKQAAHSIAQLDYKLKSGKEAMKLKGIGKQIGNRLYRCTWPALTHNGSHGHNFLHGLQLEFRLKTTFLG